MRRILAPALVAVTALAGPPRSLQAQPRFELVPIAGYRTGGEIVSEDERRLDGLDVDVEIDESALYGLLLDIPIHPNLQIELLANRQQSALRTDEGLFVGGQEIGDIDVSYYHAGLLWQWGRGQANPFVVFSAGLARLDPDVPGADAEDRFSAALGGGVKIYFDRHFGVRFEGRGYWTQLDEDRDRRCCRRRDYDDDYLYQVEGTAGLILAW
jgi:hypothetical protein